MDDEEASWQAVHSESLENYSLDQAISESES